MSDAVDPWQSPKSRQRLAAVFAMGKQASPSRHIAILWSVQVLQLALIMTSRYWIDPLPQRLVFVLAVIVIPMRWTSGLKPPSAHLRWEPGIGARLSGKFLERNVPVTQVVIADTVGIDGDRLVFGLSSPAPARATGTLSLDCSAFRTVTGRDLHALFSAALVGDANALAAIATANGMKPRERPGLVSVPIIEDKTTPLIAMVGAFGLLALAYPIWRALP